MAPRSTGKTIDTEVSPKTPTSRSRSRRLAVVEGSDVVAPVTEDMPVVTETGGGVLRKKALVAAVVAATGRKPRDVRPVVEATLAALAQGLGGVDSAALAPLGKMRVMKRMHDADGALTSLTIKLRPANDSPADAASGEADMDAEKALAEPGAGG